MDTTGAEMEAVENARHRAVIAALEHETRCGIKLVCRVLSLPSGGWPETRQAEMQAAEELPRGISLDEAIAAVRAHGLADDIHPGRR